MVYVIFVRQNNVIINLKMGDDGPCICTQQYTVIGSTKMVVQDEYIRFFKYLERTDLNIPCR